MNLALPSARSVALLHRRATLPAARLATRTMATTKYDVVVKGDPNTSTLKDCPFCHRVLLTLETKNIPYGMTYVDFANKPQWLIEQSGGKVPVIRKEGMDPMPDSDVITVMLEKQHPSPSMASDVDPSIGSKLFPSFRGFLTSQAGSPEEAEKKSALEAELAAINDYLSQTGMGPLFGGDKMNATDAAVAPKLYHVSVALPHFKHYSIPEKFAAVHKYLSYIKTLPAWKAVDYGEAAIIEGWSKHH